MNGSSTLISDTENVNGNGEGNLPSNSSAIASSSTVVVDGTGAGISDLASQRAGDARPGTSQKKAYLHGDEMKFMENFDPNERVTKKKLKKFTEFGVVEEKCDCLIWKCPGCHLPCPSCGSRFCSDICRNERHWEYETLEIQGKGITRTKPENAS